MKVIDVNKSNFEEEVLKSTTKVLVDFNADWCGPCKMLRPVLDEIAETNDNIKIVSINVDLNEKLAREYNVFSIPCLVLIEDGKEVNRSVGMIPKSEVEKLIGE
jgi:thioredoxin 1